jgi:hypothetical protein
VRDDVGGASAFGAHSHVERTVLAKRESALRAVELDRGHAEVGQDAVGPRGALEGAIEIAEVRFEEGDAIAKPRETLPRRRQGLGIAVESEEADPRTALEERGGVAAGTERGVDEEAAPLGREDPNDVVEKNGNVQFNRRSPVDSQQQFRELVVVLGTEVFGRELLREAAAIGHDEVIDVPGDHDVGRELRGVAQDLRHEHAPLRVEDRVLAVEIDALEKLVFRAMDRRQLRELLFERSPDRQRVQKEIPSVNRRDEQIAPERLFDLLTEEIRHLEPALFVESGRRASTKAIHPSDVVPFRMSGTTFSHF